MGVGVRDTVPLAALEAAMKGKVEARVQRLQMEVESLKARVVERDEVIASMTAPMKDLEAEHGCV